MLDRVQELVGGPIYAVLGGTHMVESSEASIDRTIAYFKDKGVEVIGVSHCTGQAAMDGFKVFGDKYFHNRTGSSLFVE
jgi:7,8-dihydropterin-6-yl-methyl-4-(beta-D-ribofuranosyl)aminobenzene 5'-phosphate synthase